MPRHEPVLSKELIELLEPRPGSVAIDCTLGGGGHTHALWQLTRPGGRVLAIDQDAAAVEAARRRFADLHDPPQVVQGNFADVVHIATAAGIESAQAVVFDLGLSSDQLDLAERGFSFQREGPLDMRMNPEQPVTAARYLNQLPERELAHHIRELGEERWAARIAQFIVRSRPLATTSDLRRAVEAAVPRAAWPKGIHPATRTFQAIRMLVNDELQNLSLGLQGANQLLTPGGRMAAISFHSLEDALVKSYFIAESKDCICPPQQPVCTCAHRASLTIVTRRPLRPSPAEVLANPRSRSARLRVAQKL